VSSIFYYSWSHQGHLLSWLAKGGLGAIQCLPCGPELEHRRIKGVLGEMLRGCSVSLNLFWATVNASWEGISSSVLQTFGADSQKSWPQGAESGGDSTHPVDNRSTQNSDDLSPRSQPQTPGGHPALLQLRRVGVAATGPQSGPK
jgi:hypothetical protein